MPSTDRNHLEVTTMGNYEPVAPFCNKTTQFELFFDKDQAPSPETYTSTQWRPGIDFSSTIQEWLDEQGYSAI